MRRASVVECAGPRALLTEAEKAAEGCRTPRPGGVFLPFFRISTRPVDERFRERRKARRTSDPAYVGRFRSPTMNQKASWPAAIIPAARTKAGV